MMKMKQPLPTLLLIIFGFFSSFPIQAQHQPVSEVNDGSSAPLNPEDQFTCGTEERHQLLLHNDSIYRRKFLLHAHQLDSVLNNTSFDRRALPPQYTIPVVVHVIHLGEPVGTGSNISDAQVQAAISGMNERFHNNNGQGADCEIDFCLATRTPEGCPTTGILRVDGSGVPNYTVEGIEYSGPGGASEAAIKALSHWPPLDYYNIWVVHDIYGDWAGYAYFPGTSELDGTVIGREFMTGDGKTLSHELGHGLNLKHTFQGDGSGNDCPANSNCMTMGDLICDTPPQRRNDCGSTNPCSNEGNWNNSRYNWMSYCVVPANLGRFTQDQRTRMRATMLVSPRAELLNSMGCAPMDLPEFTSDDDPMCSGESKDLAAMPQGGDFSVISGPGELQGDILTATGEGTIMIQYSTCNYDVFQNIEAYQTPEPYFTSTDNPMCSGTTRIMTCEPPGGDFILISGPGSLQENELTAEAPGTLLIEYNISTNGCSGDTFQEIMVEVTPEPEITSSDLPLCDGELRVLSGFPIGGDFYIISGPATLNGDTLIPEGNGTVILEYDVLNNDCPASTTQTILVSSVPVPAITSSAQTLCSGDERILSAIPLGGNFSVLSGPGVIIGDTLTSTGNGLIHIEYSLTLNGCTATAGQIINSLQGIAAGFINPPDHLCVDDSIALHAFPAGGTFQLWSGPGTLNLNILRATGTGNILIGYSVTQNGCTGSAEKLVTSAETFQPIFTMDTSMLCSGDSRALNVTPEGGIFWIVGGPGMVGNGVLTSTGAGLIKLAYLVNDNGCVGENLQLLTSRLTPQVEFATDTLYMCVAEEKLVDIIPASSQLNLISGMGILSGHLLTSTGQGTLELTGQYEENGCVGMDTLSVSSNPVPVPEITVIDTVICNGNSVQLTADPPGGAFEIMSGPGTLNGNILTAFDIGPIKIKYTKEENNCAGHVQGEILVIDPVAGVLVYDNLLTSVSHIGVFQWLDCENNFEPLPGETNDTLFVTQAGSYALVNGAGDCIDTSACVLAKVTSTYPLEPDQRIRVFPNPVTSNIFIDVSDDQEIREIRLFNSLGNMVMTNREMFSGEFFDMSVYPGGIYFLVIKLGDGQDYIFRLVKI
jgi:hypothetical protein